MCNIKLKMFNSEAMSTTVTITRNWSKSGFKQNKYIYMTTDMHISMKSIMQLKVTMLKKVKSWKEDLVFMGT